MGRLLDRIKAPRGTEPEYPSPYEVDFIRWSHVPADEAAGHDHTIRTVLDHEHDGLVITGVLDPDEVARASERFRSHADWHEVAYGGLWGQPVGIAWDGDRREYFDKAERAREEYLEVFGFDITERLVSTFSTLSGGATVGVAEEDGRPYLPGGFREMRTGAGGLPAHTGNEFFDIGLDGPLSHLAATTRYVNSLSWFIMVEPPDEGGELRLYDLKYEDRPDLRGFNNFDRDDTPFDAVTTAALRPEAGDMVWFRGGDQWHKVAQIRGTAPRVTYGGFMAPSLDEQHLVFWA